MKIRSITYFTNPGWPIDQSTLDQAAQFIAKARSLFDVGGYEVQTARLATPPFPRLLPDSNPTALSSSRRNWKMYSLS
jgi:hypothetical protein